MKIITKILFVILAFAAASCSGKYNYESVEGDPMDTRIYTLDNGLKVYMNVNKETPRIQTYIAVRVGGKNDPAETTGLAHYFEHLMFKGTEDFGTQDYAQEKPLLDEIEAQFEIYRKTTDPEERKARYHIIDSLSYEASKLAIPNEYDKLMAAIGSSGTNAYTSFDQTVYVEDIPANQVENWAKIQADRFKHNVIRGFHTELETVYEEKNMSLTSDSRKMTETMLSALFKNHPYGKQTVLGTQEHLKNPSITNIKNYYKNWYVPNNMAICLSGDFNPDEMIATIDKYFGDMQPNPELQALKFEDEQPITQPIVKEVKGLEAENVMIAWRADKASSEKAQLMTIADMILHNGQAGLFDLDLIQPQKVLWASSGTWSLADYGVFLMQGAPKTGQTLDEVKDLMLAEVAKLKAGDFDDALLPATVENLKLQLMKQMDSNQGRANMYVDAFVNCIAWKDYVSTLDRLSKITKADVVAYANEIFGDNDYALLYKRQGKDPDEKKIEKPTITPIFMNRDTASVFLRDIQATKVTPIQPVFVDYNKDLGKLTAKQGIEMLYKKNPTTGLFSLSYVFETGKNNDPALGMAFDYLEYLGTSTMTPEQVKKEFYNIACNFSTSAGSERSYITVSGLGENMGKAMDLMESILADAKPNPEALAGLVTDELKSRIDSKSNQRANFSRLQSYAIYGPKSSVTNVLSEEQLKSLKSEDLLGRIKNLTGMQHRIFYYGPMDEQTVLNTVNEHHHVPETLAAVPELIRFKPQTTAEDKVILAEYDAAQIYFQQYSNNGEVYDPANAAGIRMYNEYFGGGMNSIVFQEMREARGLAYSAQAYFSSPSKAGDTYGYSAFIATQNDKTSQAMDAFEEIIEKMPQSENAFQLAKDGLLNNMEAERIIKDQVIWSYVRAQDLGLDYDIRKTIYEQIKGMTLADVVSFQNKWVKGRKYTYSILGRSADLDMKKLEAYGPITKVSQKELFGY